MNEQLSMIDLWTPPVAVMRRACDPFGEVLQGEPDEYLHLPRKGNVNPLAEIELHRHSDGQWMWSASYGLLSGSGSSYKVGPKWGRFAATRDDALSAAIDELITGIGRREACPSIPKIFAWARSLR